MIKLIIVGRRAAGTTRQGAHVHLRRIHGAMVVNPPGDAGAMPTDYVQNHVVDGVYPAGRGPHSIERDLVTELWFDDIAHLQASTTTPYYLANLKPDEPRFVDDATVAKMMVVPRELVAGAVAPFKAFLMIAKGDDAAWSAAAAVLADRLGKAHGMSRAVENRVLPPPGGGAPFVDLIGEAWFADRADAAALVADFAAVLDGFAPAAIDRDRCLAVVAEEYGTARLRAGLA